LRNLVSDPKLAVGKLFALWVDFAKFYEKNQQINDARIIFEKATHVAYLKVDDLANVWCEWVEMELRYFDIMRYCDIIQFRQF
jgi:pre-mRNA-splicing factor SYF1